MAVTPTKNALLDESVTFIQNDVPGFEAGKYRLTISQQLTSQEVKAPAEPDDAAKTVTVRINDGGLDAAYTFAVQGDRFAFSKPDQTLYSVFPPPDDDGAFETSLPHVVLTETNFPWMRSPTDVNPPYDPISGRPTWLTVLLLDQSDLDGHPLMKLEPTSGTVGDLFPPAAYAASKLGENYSYFAGATSLDRLEPGQSAADACSYIDVPLELFWEIAPTIADLALMAHVREVSLLAKQTIAGVSDKGTPLGRFSIVFGNRLPQRGLMAQAYLVSLEALEDFLPDSENGGRPAGSPYDGKKFLRLAVLKQWQFRSVGQPASFVTAMMALNTGEIDANGDPVTTLRLCYDGQNEVVKRATEMGYVPLDTSLRTAEKTVSWYRGPLAPYAVTSEGPKLPVNSPDAAMIFDPTTGLFDMSQAAAWTIGRMLALQDGAYAAPYYKWKKVLHQSVATRVENRLLGERTGQLRFSALPDGIRIADDHALRGAYHHMIHSLLEK